MPFRTIPRIATKDDTSKIYKLLLDMHSESKMGSLNKSKVLEKILHVFHNGIIIVTETNEEISGTMGLLPFDFWWSDDKALGDQWLFVSKKYRSTRSFHTLVNSAKKISEQAKLPLLLANFGTVAEERKSKLYERLGVKMGTTIMTGYKPQSFGE